MLPTTKPDTTTRVTEAQILQALASLAGLPSRQADEDGVDKAMYFVALEGVTRYALSEAVKAVMRNKLGHTFFPSPVELRRLCDDAQRPLNEMARRVAVTEQMARDREEHRRIRETWTPEARARAKARYDAFCRDHEANKAKQASPERIGPPLDPELLALVEDAPSPFTTAVMA